MFRLLLIFILSCLTFQSLGQEIKVKGNFLQDTTKVGLQVQFSLAVSYPRHMDVVFPDSTFNFSPFEIDKKTYSPTISDSSYSYDSTIYTLTTFELDTTQFLKLPVFVVVSGDSIPYYSKPDSIILDHVVTSIPDSLNVEEMPLIENTEYIPLDLQFNYPYLIIGLTLWIIIILAVLLIFGKKIKKWWRIRKMTKRYNNFRIKFTESINTQSDPRTKALRAISIWKSFMEKLTQQPYTTLTTKEIYVYEQDEQLRNVLKTIDRTIYSQNITEVDLEIYKSLEENTDQKFHKKLEELKHG